MKKQIEVIERLRYKDRGDNIGKNTSAVIYIPEELIQRKKKKGLTLHLNLFWICKDLLRFREHTEHKIAISSNPSDVRIGDKNYTSSYVKTEIIVPKEELYRISELIKKS